MGKTRDPVNQPGYDKQVAIGQTQLGVLTNFDWHSDPRRLLFRLARYKFVAKMFAGRSKVLELGCGDAFVSPIILQEVDDLTVSDFDQLFLADAEARMREPWTFKTMRHDLLDFYTPIEGGPYDGIFALDVLEHIPAEKEHYVLMKIARAMTSHGALIIGMPSLESQAYASDVSKAGHINCLSMPDLKALMLRYFHNVFAFSMSDEVVHTGYHAMAHYILTLCCDKRDQFVERQR